MNASLWALVCVPAALICMCNIMGFHELSPLSLSATHPADHSNPDPSSLHVAHFAQSILRLGDVKLPCQLGHTTSCWKRREQSKKVSDGEFDHKYANWTNVTIFSKHKRYITVLLTSWVSQFEFVGESIICEYCPVDKHTHKHRSAAKKCGWQRHDRHTLQKMARKHRLN